MFPSVRHQFDRELPCGGVLALLRPAAPLCMHTPFLISDAFSRLADPEIEVNSAGIELEHDEFGINVPWRMSSC